MGPTVWHALSNRLNHDKEIFNALCNSYKFFLRTTIAANAEESSIYPGITRKTSFLKFLKLLRILRTILLHFYILVLCHKSPLKPLTFHFIFSGPTFAVPSAGIPLAARRPSQFTWPCFTVPPRTPFTTWGPPSCLRRTYSVVADLRRTLATKWVKINIMQFTKELVCHSLLFSNALKVDLRKALTYLQIFKY